MTAHAVVRGAGDVILTTIEASNKTNTIKCGNKYTVVNANLEFSVHKIYTLSKYRRYK